MTSNQKKPKKKYLIALEETRSIVALVSGIIIVICTLGAVFYMLEKQQVGDEHSLHYFTVLSNLVSATGAAFMIPFAVEGIRKKRFVLPKWVVIFQYVGATGVAITLMASLAIILPTQGLKSMAGANFWLHIITPASTVILFQCVESGITFGRRYVLLPMIPYCAYMLTYFVNVIVIGEENGGWTDFYMTQAFWPAWVSGILMLAIGAFVSALLRFVQNKRAIQSKKRIAKAWGDHLERQELLIEAFGLGRYIGSKCSADELTVPIDVFEMMAERYDVTMEKLVKAYNKGALDSIKEKNGTKVLGKTLI